MAIDKRRLKEIIDFESLVRFLADELDWPIMPEELESLDDAAFDFTPEELGIDKSAAANIRIIKQLRPLTHGQPWAIYFIDFERAGLNITGLRRVLSKFVAKQRAADATRATHEMEDILFVTTQGEEQKRGVVFAHFFRDKNGKAMLRDFSWDQTETNLHFYAKDYLPNLRWPDDPDNINAWRHSWQRAFKYSTRAAISEAKELSQVMATLARDVRKRVHQVYLLESDDGPVHKLFDSFRRSLVRDMVIETKDPKLTSFADIFAQTITYGLFTARFMNPDAEVNFGTLIDAMPETNPFLKELFAECLDLAESDSEDIDLDELGIGNLLELMGRVQTRKIVEEFGRQTRHEDPIIHFYEGFLNAYESEQRKRRGVYYTPDPVVSFIVRSVDEILKDEFKLPLGLADTTTWAKMSELHGIDIPDKVEPDTAFVQILDPAVGTGTFLKHVIQVVYATMTELWESEGLSEQERAEAWNEYVPNSLLPRLHGYELMLAPYAVCHMKLGYYLKHITGYDFSGQERVRVYLTNALEPWVDQYEMSNTALAHEANEVNAVKRDQRFTVVIGNPPYAQYSMNLDEKAKAHIEKFRYANGEKIRTRNALQLERNLNDDYVKFLGMSADQIPPSIGVLGMITNRMFLDSESLVGMREWFATHFSKSTVLDLSGSSEEARRIDRLAEDENVFDIKQGVAISIHRRGCIVTGDIHSVRWRKIVGARDYKNDLLLEGSALGGDGWRELTPHAPEWWFDREASLVMAEAFTLDKVFPEFSTLVASNRDHLVVNFDRENVIADVRAVQTFVGSDEDLCEHFGITMKRGWNINVARKKLGALEDIADSVRIIEYRPFDRRWIFFHPTLVWQTAPVCSNNVLDRQNLILVSLGKNRAETVNGQWITAMLADKSVVTTRDNASGFPLYIFPRSDSLDFSGTGQSGPYPNLGREFLARLGSALDLSLTAPFGLPEGVTPEDTIRYIYALLQCPSFRRYSAEALVSGFPPIHLPGSHSLFEKLSDCGDQLVGLHLMESPKIDDHITELEGSGDFQVMKVSYSDETVWVDKAQTRGFRGVPKEVWNFHIGGYQVCEKWLKDRQAKGGKNPRPGRVLTDEDIDHYQKIVVALSETIRIMAEIDEVIESHGGWPDAFVTK